MAFTRKMLNAMSIDDEKIDQIIEVMESIVNTNRLTELLLQNL